MIKTIELKNRNSMCFKNWLQTLKSDEAGPRLFLAASGYESRCTNLVGLLDEALPGIFEKRFERHVFAFQDHVNVLSRPANDEKFHQLGCDTELISASDWELSLIHI